MEQVKFKTFPNGALFGEPLIFSEISQDTFIRKFDKLKKSVLDFFF